MPEVAECLLQVAADPLNVDQWHQVHPPNLMLAGTEGETVNDWCPCCALLHHSAHTWYHFLLCLMFTTFKIIFSHTDMTLVLTLRTILSC